MAKIEGTRLEAQDITRALPATEVNDCSPVYAGKFILGISFYVFGLFAGTKLGISPWLKDPVDGILALAIAFLPPNNEAIMWWLSEQRHDSRITARIHSGFKGDELPTSPRSIEVGDYIRRVKDKSPTNYRGPSRAAINQAANSGGQLQGSGQSTVQHPQISLKYYRVVAKLVSMNSGRVWIAALGLPDCYDTDPADSHNIYFRRKAPIPGASSSQDLKTRKISEALNDLIELLSKNGGRMHEEDLGGQLINRFHHDPSAVRLAFRIAEYGKLIIRQTRGKYVLEQLKVFNWKAVVTGHESCEISLTESGRTWERAGSEYRAKDHPRLSGAVMNNNFYLNQGIAGSMGHENTSHITVTNSDWKNFQGLDANALAQELAELRAELRKHSTSPEQDLAIAEVASALLSAEKGDGAGAAANLAKLGSHSASVRKWIVDNATSIGIPLAIAVIKQALHIPSNG